MHLNFIVVGNMIDGVGLVLGPDAFDSLGGIVMQDGEVRFGSVCSTAVQQRMVVRRLLLKIRISLLSLMAMFAWCGGNGRMT